MNNHSSWFPNQTLFPKENKVIQFIYDDSHQQMLAVKVHIQQSHALHTNDEDLDDLSFVESYWISGKKVNVDCIFKFRNIKMRKVKCLSY